MKKYLCICLCLLGFQYSMAQSYRISGKLVILPDSMPAQGARALLFGEDQKPINGAISDSQGRFSLNAKNKGTYQLTLVLVGYDTLRQTVTLAEKESKDLGILGLNQRSFQLGEVQIESDPNPVIQKGDTTEYAAGAYKTNPDANAQDLLEKMPGIVNENGRTQAQGEDVQQVLVDGQRFFGDDATAALRNLPAEVISRVQVFDQQSEQAQFTGFDDGNTTKTINIITKPNMRTGQFGKVYAGYGERDLYQAGAAVNLFKGSSRLTFLGQSNNINDQNFAAEDLAGVLGTSGRGRRRFGGGGARPGGGGGRGPGGGGFRGGGAGASTQDFLVGQQDGITSTNSLGFNYTDKWGDKVDINASYFFNQSDNEADQDLNQLYFLEGQSNQVYSEISENNSTNMNHRFNMRLDYRIDSSNSILFRPRVSIQQNDGTELTNAETFAGAELLNSSGSDFNSEITAMNIGGTILYRHRFEKRGRTISVNLQPSYNMNNADSRLFSSLDFFTRPTSSDTVNQTSDLESNGFSIGANVSYTEPIGEKSQLQLEYSIEPQWNDSDQRTYAIDGTNGEIVALDTVLSNTFTNTYTAQQFRVGYRFGQRASKFNFSARLALQHAELDNEQEFPTSFNLDRTFLNVIPNLSLNYRISSQKNLRIFYRARTSPPSLTQLQDVVNNNNPLQLSTGNPDLKQNFQHFMVARYSATNTFTSEVFFAVLFAQFTQNFIGNQTIIAARDTLINDEIVLQQGGQLSRPVNLDGQMNLRSFITYGTPLRWMKSNFNMNLRLGFNRQPGLVNDVKNFSDTYTAGIGLTISSNISQNVDFTLSSRSDFSRVNNSVQSNLDTDYFTQTTRARLNLIFLDGFVFRSTLSHQLYDGLAEGFDQNFFLWNLALGKKFFKNDRGELTLSVFDVLEQNNSISRTVNDIYVEDLRTQVLQRYVMLTFTYQIRHFRAKNNSVPN